jgi:FlaA1/EpsC-like NDP-sugar epimerase
MSSLASRGDWVHDRVLKLSRHQKRLILAPADAILLAFSLWAAVALRLGQVWPMTTWITGWWLWIAIPILGVAIFYLFGFYRFVVRSTGRHDLTVLARATTLLSLVLAAVGYFDPSIFLPRSTPIIFGLVAFGSIVAFRLTLRAYYKWLEGRGSEPTPVIIYGAGESGTQLVTALDGSSEFRAVGFVDDEPSLVGSIIAGRRVHSPGQIEALAEKHGVKDVFLAFPSASRERRKKVIELLNSRPLRIKTIPSMADLLSGTQSIATLREIEVDELLQRDAVDPMLDLYSSVRGKSVLVTGAGGSIGSELCRQVMKADPKQVVLFEISEIALYLIEQELSAACEGSDIQIVAVLGSVCDARRLEFAMREHGVQTVFHAAAYKHVPLVEANPIEGVRNNTMGTRIVADVAQRCGVERVMLVSTDKAVRPPNVMGASKRMAELAMLEAHNRQSTTIFSMVRFGNVMGSSGSVIPLFKRQLAVGGPLTVTHPEVIRYFMTIPEAAQLVVQASSMATGGDVFLLDMGEPVRIVDLARQMIHLSGLEVRDENNPGGDIEIAFTGLRPGEKLFEELLVNADSLATSHPKIMRAMDAPMAGAAISAAMDELERAVDRYDVDAAMAVLNRTVEGFAPQRGASST